MSKKKSHGIQLLIRAVVRDPDGKIITDTGRKPARSFVIQFLEFIRYLMDGITGLATDVDEAEVNIVIITRTCSAHLRLNALINDSDFGVVIGTGDAAETNTDFKLQTQLTEGVGAGNITHGAVTVGTTAVVGANVDLEVKRAFTNNTGSTITVKEAGLYIYRYYTSADTSFMIVRDVLAASVDVPDKCSLTVYYTVRTAV